MARVRMSYDHTLDAVKGWMPGNMGALDNSGRLSGNVTIDPVYAGRVVHRNDAGEYEMGVTGTQMAIFLFQNSDDTDVNNEGGTDWQPISPTGVMSGFVATGAYEVATTEFDDTQTYHVNDPLRATASNSNASTGGVITNAGVAVHTNAVIGVVSRLPEMNCHKKRVITLWPVYCPGTAGL